MEEQISDGAKRQIGYVNIALYPLAHNNDISGKFPLLSVNYVQIHCVVLIDSLMDVTKIFHYHLQIVSNAPTEASIDISIRWKFPYHPPESELKLANINVLS